MNLELVFSFIFPFVFLQPTVVVNNLIRQKREVPSDIIVIFYNKQKCPTGQPTNVICKCGKGMTCQVGGVCDPETNTCGKDHPCPATVATSECKCNGKSTCQKGDICNFASGTCNKECPMAMATVPCACGTNICEPGELCGYSTGNCTKPLKKCPALVHDRLPPHIVEPCICEYTNSQLAVCEKKEYCIPPLTNSICPKVYQQQLPPYYWGPYHTCYEYRGFFRSPYDPAVYALCYYIESVNRWERKGFHCNRGANATGVKRYFDEGPKKCLKDPSNTPLATDTTLERNPTW